MIPTRSMLSVCLLVSGSLLSVAQDGPAGISMPTVLAPFNANAPSCSAPPGLQKVLAFAQDNERQFMQGVARGLASAATTAPTLALRKP